MSQQSELFDRAADCERLKNLTSDHYKRLTFRLMRDLWIALANECAGMSKKVLLNEIAELDKMQSDLSKTQLATLADQVNQQRSPGEMPDVKILKPD